MKKILIPIFLLVLAACNDKKKTPVVIAPPPTDVRDTVPNHDDFGLKPTDFNITQREQVSFEKGRKVKDPPPPPPPPTTTAPSAPGVILLDFDGHIVKGTNWNWNGVDIVATPSGLSIDEQQRALDTVASWARYGRYNVIITTSDSVYNKAPINKRVRCIITENYIWYGQAGGVSYTGSFTWGDTPCFVFSLLLNYNTKMIYEAICHEVGHTLGLYHQVNCIDGIKTSEYNYGDANFAPIMGVAYYSSSAGWTKGPNSYGCTTMQDDTLIIKNKLK